MAGPAGIVDATNQTNKPWFLASGPTGHTGSTGAIGPTGPTEPRSPFIEAIITPIVTLSVIALAIWWASWNDNSFSRRYPHR